MRKFAALIFFTIAILAPVFSDGQIVVSSVRYEIDGRTLAYYLAQKAELPVGMSFPDEESFEAYLARVKQRLMNERVLESVEVSAEFGPPNSEGNISADVLVAVKDTWNIIALPYFRYDSNSGLLLSVRARDYNFLGSMLPLRINANYETDIDGTTVWGGDFDFSYPFPALGFDWSWDLDGSIGFYEDGLNPEVIVGTGLSTKFDAGPGKLDVGMSQSLYMNGRDSDDVNYEDRLYFNTNLHSGWTVSLWESDLGESLNLRPYASVSGIWSFTGLEDESLKTAPLLGGGAGLSYGSVDWIGNFREGWKASSDASLSYSLATGSWDRFASASASLFKSFNWFGFSMRVSGFYDFDGVSSSAGSDLRGILNRRAETDAAIVVNMDFPILVINFKPSEWFGKSWMRLFNFEQHWSPYIDFSEGHYDDTWFLVTKGWYAGGLEIITFPGIMRSFYIRISAGWSLVDVAQMRALSGSSPRDDETIRELYIGLGHHY